MTDEMRDKMLERVKKLLNLAKNNSSEEEATAANEKAHAILAEYNLSMSDVQTTEIDRDEVETLGGLYTSVHPWRRPIARAVAEMHFCKYLYRNANGKQEHMFVGTKANATVASMMSTYLFETVDRLAYQGSKSVSTSQGSPFRVAFRAAAAGRLSDRIYQRIEAAKRGGEVKVEGKNLPALMSLYQKYDAATQAYVSKMYGKTKTSVAKLRTGLHQRGAAEGWAAGNSIGLDQQVGKGSQKRLR
jgi:hypothetical protein